MCNRVGSQTINFHCSCNKAPLPLCSASQEAASQSEHCRKWRKSYRAATEENSLVPQQSEPPFSSSSPFLLSLHAKYPGKLLFLPLYKEAHSTSLDTASDCFRSSKFSICRELQLYGGFSSPHGLVERVVCG